MVNQSGPMGGVTWGQGPNGQITMNTGFTGPAQGVWNQVEQLRLTPQFAGPQSVLPVERVLTEG